MSSTAASTHYFVTQTFDIDILYARIQQRNVFKLNFDVQVFVAKKCDDSRDDSAMESTLDLCVCTFFQ